MVGSRRVFVLFLILGRRADHPMIFHIFPYLFYHRFLVSNCSKFCVKQMGSTVVEAETFFCLAWSISRPAFPESLLGKKLLIKTEKVNYSLIYIPYVSTWCLILFFLQEMKLVWLILETKAFFLKNWLVCAFAVIEIENESALHPNFKRQKPGKR